MVVFFTANLGLAKPDDFELAANWARFTQLQEDNNTIIENEFNKINNFYTPTIIAAGGGANIGASQEIYGEYTEYQGIVSGHCIAIFNGAGLSGGTGEIGISLPFVIDNSFYSVGTALNQTPGSFSIIGEGYLYDNSTTTTSGTLALDTVTVGGVSYMRMLNEAFTSPAKTSRLVTNGQPTTFAAGDRFLLDFYYKRQ